MVKDKEYVSVTEAAAELGIARQSIWKMIMSKDLKATKVAEVYIIQAADVQRIKKKRIETLRQELAILEGKGRN